MNLTINDFKPSVNKQVLLLLAGFLWIAVGIMLLHYSYRWLFIAHDNHWLVFSGIGIGLAMLIHHFGFLKIVDRNLQRILPMEGKKCVFSFMPWKSYLMISVMMTTGILLRHSSIPKPYLSVLYTGVGLALILSSVRYLRMLIYQLKT